MNNVDKELKIRRDYRDRISLLEKQNRALIKEKEAREHMLSMILFILLLVTLFVVGFLTGMLYERGLLV